MPTTAPGGAASVRKRGANVLNEPHLVAFRGPVRPRGGRRSDRNHEPSWFSASELASRSGVPVATIHHYLRRGLLPPPKALGRHRFLFDDSHLEALLLVRQLRERRLSLPVIRELLPELLASRRAPAFRDEMWDELVAQHVAEHGPAHQRGQLVKLALEAFGARGFDGVQVAELCDRAGIAKGSFYKAFASKEELYAAAVLLAADEAADRLVSRKRSPSTAPRPSTRRAPPSSKASSLAAARLAPSRAAARSADLEVATALAQALAQRLPLLLDAAARAARGEPDAQGLLGSFVQRLEEAVRSRLATTPHRASGSRVRAIVADSLGAAVAGFALGSVPRSHRPSRAND